MSFRYGTRSLECLATVHADLVGIFHTAIHVVDITILTGARSKMAQDLAFDEGRSKVQWPNSLHNLTSDQPLSFAIDFAPYPIDWNDIERFRAVAFFLRGIGEAQGTPLRLGADWDSDFSFRDQTFHDVGHVELAER